MVLYDIMDMDSMPWCIKMCRQFSNDINDSIASASLAQ